MGNNQYEGCLAIDLGTTNSVMTMIDEDGNYKLIPNKEGDILTPSFVYYNPENSESGLPNTFVGKKAKDMMITDPTNILCSYKSRIGDNIILKKFKTSAGVKGITPEICSKLVLRKLVRDASDYIKRNITDVVISVPARFTDKQRNATKYQATSLGLNVLNIISEPTASAFYYGLNSDDGKDKTILAYDFGGGTFDASVISISGTEVGVAATEGNINLGGDHIDNNIAKQLCAKTFGTSVIFENLDLNSQEMFIRRAELAKIQLAEKYYSVADTITDEVSDVDLEELINDKLKSTYVSVQVDDINTSDGLQPKSKSVRLKYSDYVIACREVVKKTISITDKLMKYLSENDLVSYEDITDILLVGGSSKNPIVKQEILKYVSSHDFTGNNYNRQYFDKYLVDPDKAVSLGAASYMKAIVDNNTTITDIVSIPIGIGVKDDATGNVSMHTIVHRGTALGTRCTSSVNVTNANIGETTLKIQVYEGFSNSLEENEFIGDIAVDISEKQAEKPGSVSISVNITVDKNGIITCGYSDITNARRGKATFIRKVEVDDNNDNDDIDFSLDNDEKDNTDEIDSIQF